MSHIILFLCKTKELYSTTRFEDKYGYDSRDSILIYDWYKRFYSFHRLEISFSKRFKLGLTESMLYGGKSQVPVPSYQNPLNIFLRFSYKHFLAHSIHHIFPLAFYIIQ